MLNKEKYQKAVLVITAFENDGIHTDLVNASGPLGFSDMLPVINVGGSTSGLADLKGQRDTFRN